MKKRVVCLILVLLLSVAAGCAAPAAAPNTGGYWPGSGWRTSAPEEQGMDSKVLADMIDSIRISGKSIDSVTIIRNGYLVDETYFYPYQKGYKHAVNSDTKSILSALVGIAIEEGKIPSIDKKILDYFPSKDIANMDERKQNLTIRNLLTMTTGFDGLDDVGAATGQMTASADWTKYTLDLPMKEQPGTSFAYCNGAANVMSAILQKATGKTAAEYAVEKLKPLGIKDLFWSSDPEGISTGYSGIYMSPDDAAKFGYLYLNNGVWNGEQVVPRNWVEESTKQQAAGGWTPLFPGYGYMWWMNRFGGYAALGFGGNYIFVVPEKDLVVVFTSGIFDYQNLFYPGELMEQYVIPSIKSESALKPDKASENMLKKAAESVGEPQAEPALSLPPLASEISGKPFTVSNEDGSKTITLNFDGSSEFTVDLDSNTVKVGLDGVYRVCNESNSFGTYTESHKARKGGWKYENTLQIFERDMEDGFETIYTVCFDNGMIVLSAEYNLGYKLILTGKYPQGVE